ncbi:hypothetical protein BR93DRAFT_609721 [Coniochaeta sp. PMI_546]|nr:hypothetical protein BR93DRAFT_609721 [Coniochaeta sp. PMI_546]
MRSDLEIWRLLTLEQWRLLRCRREEVDPIATTSVFISISTPFPVPPRPCALHDGNISADQGPRSTISGCGGKTLNRNKVQRVPVLNSDGRDGERVSWR